MPCVHMVVSMTVEAERLISIVTETQRIPYAWPGPPTAAAARQSGQGTCAAKHALLREEVEALGMPCMHLMVVGLLVPSLWPDLERASGGLMEVHGCLTVATPWAGPLLVDVTWQPGAVRAGLPGTLGWDGASDMACAVQPIASYAVGDDFRSQKELLRSRLYSTAERSTRDQILAEMATRARDLS